MVGKQLLDIVAGSAVGAVIVKPDQIRLPLLVSGSAEKRGIAGHNHMVCVVLQSCEEGGFTQCRFPIAHSFAGVLMGMGSIFSRENLGQRSVIAVIPVNIFQKPPGRFVEVLVYGVSLVFIGIHPSVSQIEFLSFGSPSGTGDQPDFGVFFGKHRGITKVSPNKSLEGYLGGVAFGGVFMLLYGTVLGFLTDVSISYPLMALYGLCGSAVTELGDLSFSLIKRQYGVKDYGNLIPGHGGMLDRFDSMIFAAPMLLALVELFPPLG